MPAMGGCKSCSNSDIIAACEYMAQTANPKADIHYGRHSSFATKEGAARQETSQHSYTKFYI